MRNRYDGKFNPELEKVADIVSLYFFTRLPPGENYEMEFSKDASMQPPGG